MMSPSALTGERCWGSSVPTEPGRAPCCASWPGPWTRPRADVAISGRISSILQLGTGFHPDFSGRENAFLAGVCHGLSKAEVRAKIPWIKEFSALGDFFEKPVRTYSSGMQARLFFSVAAAVEADVLLVDEALSVGDARFQRKCFTRMERFRNNGGAVILVSHDINLVKELCDQAVLLEKGRIVDQGPPREISRLYFMRVHSGPEVRVGELDSPESGERVPFADKARRYGDRWAEIAGYGIKDGQGDITEVITSGEDCLLFIRAVLNDDLEDLRFSFKLDTVSGTRVFSFGTQNHPPLGRLAKGGTVEARLNLRMWLAPGEYFLSLGVYSKGGVPYDRLQDAMLLRVVSRDHQNQENLVNLEPRLEIILPQDHSPGDGPAMEDQT